MTTALRRALRTDGILSTIAGVALLAAARPVASFTGIPFGVTVGIGAGSVLLGGTFLAVSRMDNVRVPGAAVAASNILGTAIAVLAAVTAAPPLTAAGVVSVLGVGAYTAAIGVAQYRGVRMAQEVGTA